MKEHIIKTHSYDFPLEEIIGRSVVIEKVEEAMSSLGQGKGIQHNQVREEMKEYMKKGNKAEDAKPDDISERILFIKSVEESIHDFEEGKYLSQSDIENMVREWRRSYGQ